MSEQSNTFYEQIGVPGLEKLAKEYSVNDDISFVKKRIKVGDKVLDLACGYGRVIIPLAKIGVDIEGIDLDKNIIREAKKRSKEAGLSVQFNVGNMTKLPYQNNSFDKIFCLWNSFAELQTIKSQTCALNEMKRVLKVNGTATLILPNGDSKLSKNLIKRSNDGRLTSYVLQGAQAKQYIHDKKSFNKLLMKTRFSKCEIRHINMHKRRRMMVCLEK